MYSVEQFEAAEDLAPKMSSAVPSGTPTGVVYAAMAQLMAAHFANDPNMGHKEITKYMEAYTKLILELVRLRRAHRELN